MITLASPDLTSAIPIFLRRLLAASALAVARGWADDDPGRGDGSMGGDE